MNAPRLTSNRLDDLAEALIVIQDNIDYLNSAIGAERARVGRYDSSPNNLPATITLRLASKRDALVRSLDWIERKVATEREKRA